MSGTGKTQVGVVGVAGGTPVGTSGGSPSAANVLDGVAQFSADATNTLITIPAGRTWVGVVGLQVGAKNEINTATGEVQCYVATADAGVTPAAGPFALCTVDLAATAAGATVGVNDVAETGNVPIVVIAPAGNSVRIQVNRTTVGTISRSQVNAWAIGALQ